MVSFLAFRSSLGPVSFGCCRIGIPLNLRFRNGNSNILNWRYETKILLRLLPQQYADSKIQVPTDKLFLRYRQLNVRRLLIAADYCRELFRCLDCAQEFDYRAFGRSRRLGGAAKHFIGGTEKAFVGWALNFRIMNGAVCYVSCFYPKCETVPPTSLTWWKTC